MPLWTSRARPNSPHDQPPGVAPNQANSANFKRDDGLANGINDGFAATGTTTQVAATNYTGWRDTLGSNDDLRATGDNSGDSAGIIDTADYVVWKSNFGQSGGAAAVAAHSVPEPATPLLAILLAPLLLLRAFRR